MQKTDDLRKKYNLQKCVNPEHYFTIGKYLVRWQLANDNCWAKIDVAGYLNEYFIGVHKVTTLDNMVLYNICLGKFMITFGSTTQ